MKSKKKQGKQIFTGAIQPWFVNWMMMSPPEKLGLFMKFAAAMSILSPKVTKLFELSSQEKIQLGKEIEETLGELKQSIETRWK